MKNKLFLFFTFISLISCKQAGQASPFVQTNGTVDGIDVEIKYCSPKVKGRVIYGDLVPYGEVWRAGANKNTTIEFSNDVKIDGKVLSKGNYGFFIIPNENDNWIAIFSKKNDAWGTDDYKESQDALRLSVYIEDMENNKEELAYAVTNKGIKFSWSDKSFEMKVNK